MTRNALALSSLLMAGPAMAQVTVTLPLNAGANVESVSYVCAEDGTSPLTVQYINAGENSLAMIPVGDSPRIFVNVISGSGARYVAGEFEWWVKGDGATLTNQMDEGATRDCKAAG